MQISKIINEKAELVAFSSNYLDPRYIGVKRIEVHISKIVTGREELAFPFTFLNQDSSSLWVIYLESL